MKSWASPKFSKVGGDLAADIQGDWQITTQQTRETTRVNRMGGHSFTDTVQNIGSVIQVGGQSDIRMGGNLIAQGAQIDLQGGGSIQAGGNVELQAAKNSFSLDSSSASKRSSSSLKTYDETVVGTSLQSGQSLTIQSGKDIRLTGSTINVVQGAATLAAAGDVTIQAETEQHTYDWQHTGKHSGIVNTTTKAERDHLDTQIAQGSTLSADGVTILSGKDIVVTGSNVVGTNDVALTAQNNVTIEAATNTQSESHFKEKKKSGLLGSGIGFTIGTQKQSTDSKGESTTASASTVGSTAGNVTIEAGKNYKQTGSDVLAPQGDIDISAQKIDIVEAQNTNRMETETKFSKSGVTIAITSPVISAIQTASQMGKAASQTQDGRMKALAGATAVLSAKSAYDTVTADPSAGGGANIGVSIMFGGSRSGSEETQASSVAAGSTVAAGHNINLTATGAGKESDLTIQGGNIKAGNDIALKADDEINLLAAKNTAEQNSTNSSSSGGIGVSVIYGSDGFAAGVTLSASGARGKADGKDETWTNTHVEAGNKLTIESGGDTTMKGAVASGKQVVADVGGDLNVESLQDTSKYKSKQQSIGGSVTIGYGFSASVSASKGSSNSDYASVVEQSGIKAGDEGFQVNVKGNTDLKGAVIASTDKAVLDGKNMLTTATLTTSDIQNRADYKASSFGIGGSGGYGSSTIPLGGGSSAPAGGTTTPLSSSGSSVSAGAGKDSGSASSVTKSGVSGIAGNKDVRTGDAETGIAKIFDKDKVQKEVNAQMQITQAFGPQASAVVDNYAQGQMKTLRSQYTAATTSEEREAIQAKVDELRMETQVINVLIGAVTGFGNVALAQETLAAAAEEMRKITIADSTIAKGITDKGITDEGIIDGKTILTNTSGESVGGKWDLVPVKTAGTRLDLDGVCGAANERCLKQMDANGVVIRDEKGIPKLAYNAEGMAQFDPTAAGMSLAAFLETDAGKKMAGTTGGIQGREGTFKDNPYPPGGLTDKLFEAFGGEHDHIGGKITGLYDDQGNIKRGMSDAERAAREVWSAVAIVPAAPFAMAELLPPEVWKAISILLEAAK